MKILALDSTAQTATVALTEDEKLLAEYTLNNGNTHSETLLPMVESMLTQLGMEVDDVELFALSCGPGSFTGVRIGAATVKGLAFGMHKPCIGVSTLEALEPCCLSGADLPGNERTAFTGLYGAFPLGGRNADPAFAGRRSFACGVGKNSCRVQRAGPALR